MTAPDANGNLCIGRTADGDFVIGKGAAYPLADLVALLCELFAQFPQRRVCVFPLPVTSPPEEPV